MNIAILDTETIDTKNPFCYDLGVVIYNVEKRSIVKKLSLVIHEVFDNAMLMSCAFFKDKIEAYKEKLFNKSIEKYPFSLSMDRLDGALKSFSVKFVYAYNIDFDLRVINFNCQWFGAENPLKDLIPLDIWGNASEVITNTNEYKDFCRKNGFYTESGNYAVNAEKVYAFVKNERDFAENHTAVEDCLTELEILLFCEKLGCKYGVSYKKVRIISNEQLRSMYIYFNRKEMLKLNYLSKITKNDKIFLTFPEKSSQMPIEKGKDSN